MDIDKLVQLQKNLRDNNEDLKREFREMRMWETEMRKRDEQLRKCNNKQTNVPPIRGKCVITELENEPKNKENGTKPKRIKSGDSFNLEDACKKVDEDKSSISSTKTKKDSLSKETLETDLDKATKYKLEGNDYVRQQKWAEALISYDKAIEIFPYDAIFFSNRALCHLKMDNLYSAIADSTESIKLDSKYVKAYHRRVTAHMGLKNYKRAKQDIQEILRLDPKNKEANTLLKEVDKRIENSKPIIITGDEPECLKIVKNTESVSKNANSLSFSNENDKKKKIVKEGTKKQVNSDRNEINVTETKSFCKKKYMKIPDWLPEKANVIPIEVVDKPPHLRSNEPLKRIIVKETEFKELRCIQTNSNGLPNPCVQAECAKDKSLKEEAINPVTMTTETPTLQLAPKTAVQFISDWRRNKSTEFRFNYLKLIPADNIPKLFKESMETDIFNDIISILKSEFMKKEENVYPYLLSLSNIKRFRTFIMFMGKTEKESLKDLFEYCKTSKDTPKEEIDKLIIKYEI